MFHEVHFLVKELREEEFLEKIDQPFLEEIGVANSAFQFSIDLHCSDNFGNCLVLAYYLQDRGTKISKL